MKIQEAIHKYFMLRDHHHIVNVVDMALGVRGPASIPVTAWKYRCFLCGMEILELSQTGIEQLMRGEDYNKVVKWMEESRELNKK